MSIHYPVMLKQIAKHLQFISQSPHLPFAMIDCTIGTGGHSLHLLKQHPNLHIFGFDIDSRMIDHLNKNVLPELDKSVTERLKLINRSYTDIGKYSPNMFDPCKGKEGFDVILADFGYNSMHLANEEWGFSYLRDGALDMRYNPEFKKCSDVIAEMSQIEMMEILVRFGEIDKTAATLIAKAIIAQRSSTPIVSTKQLVDAVNSAIPQGRFKTVVKVFQALRIFVNSQLDDVYSVCGMIPGKVSKQGKGLMVTFHSLEHTSAMAGLTDNKQKWKVTHKVKVEEISDEQVKQNQSSRSAKLIVLDPSSKAKHEKKYKKY